MFLLMILVIIFCGSISTVLTKYSCVMENLKISCNSISTKDLDGHLEVSVSAEDVSYLTVKDSMIPLVHRTMFEKYENLHTLRLQNVQAENIEGDAFSQLISLRNLYLNDNFLHNFSSAAFATNNALYQLDLSNNLLQDLSDFDILSFPILSILNISNNKLEYLPKSLIDKLAEDNTFYLIIDNNPWDCTHPKWIDNMNAKLADTFCIQNRYDPSLGRNEMFLKKRNTSEEDASNDVRGKSCTHNSWCFSYCIFWFVGGIWIGIILGNVCKLKGLICVSNSRYQDKTTQYDNMDFRPRV